MFIFAVLIGFYSYALFVFGMISLLSRPFVMVFTIIYVGIVLFFARKKIVHYVKVFFSQKQPLTKTLFEQKFFFFLLLLFFFQASVNLIGVLGPELGFDALWYHLTLPKLYLMNHWIIHIKGGLLYYSDMPKLGELLYVGALSLSNEILAKMIQFSFGILSACVIYKLSRRFFDPSVSLIAVVIFYSNLVVDWESTTAYIDLIRTFFEITALWIFITWWEVQKKLYLIQTAIVLGLALMTKVLAVGSLCIFVILILSRNFYYRGSGGPIRGFKQVLIFIMIAFLVPIPWFIFAFVHTGNLVYPFFTHIYRVSTSPLTIVGFFRESWELFTRSADPLSPLYLIFFPLIVFYFSKFKTQVKVIVLYAVFGLIVWYLTPRTGGGRFILPYLPAISFVCAAAFAEFSKTKGRIYLFLQKFLIGIIVLVCLTSIGYRFVANVKYLPVLLGKETKATFLSKHLNFSFGDFYDTDGYFRAHIKPTDRVLLYGFHNLYYVDFPFLDSSWVAKGDVFTYIATQNAALPARFKDWRLIYTNPKTLVKLYSNKLKQWRY